MGYVLSKQAFTSRFFSKIGVQKRYIWQRRDLAPSLTMKTTMSPLFSLVAAALLPWGYEAFVVVPPATTVSRGRSVSELQANVPTVDEIQQRKDARAALLDSGGVDKLMSMLTKMRGSDTEVGAGPAPAPAPAPPAPAAKVRLLDCLRHEARTKTSSPPAARAPPPHLAAQPLKTINQRHACGTGGWVGGVAHTLLSCI